MVSVFLSWVVSFGYVGLLRVEGLGSWKLLLFWVAEFSVATWGFEGLTL